MKKRNGLLGTVLILLAATLMLAAIPTEAEAAIYEDTVRLHIRAASDDEKDQQIKLEIRDRVLSEYGEALMLDKNSEAALESLRCLTDGIERSVEEWLTELGVGYGATVRLDEEWFDTRTYDRFTLPRGYYDALIIELGEGTGQNWWCVMYPPMCLDMATSDGVYSDEENELIRAGKYSVKFKILELVSELTQNLSKNG